MPLNKETKPKEPMKGVPKVMLLFVLIETTITV